MSTKSTTTKPAATTNQPQDVENGCPVIGGPDEKREIVILQRGWIMVGNVTKQGSDIVMDNTSLIRRWGTTTGLGQLALTGPTKDTILCACGRVRVHELAVVARIEVLPRPDNRWMV